MNTNPKTAQTQILSPDQTLGELASRIPAASRVFREAGLDYCCGGGRTLASACADKDLDPHALLAAISGEKDEQAASASRRMASEVSYR